MRRVAGQPYDETVVEFALLMEHDYLTGVQETDARFHLAKLVAAGFAEPQRIWQEHEETRAAYLHAAHLPRPGKRDLTHDEWLATVARIHQKMQGAGLVSPSGAVN